MTLWTFGVERDLWKKSLASGENAADKIDGNSKCENVECEDVIYTLKWHEARRATQPNRAPVCHYQPAPILIPPL